MTRSRTGRRVSSWPLGIIAIPATVAIWSGWVGLGELTGFGPVNLLPGIGKGWTINTAITLPVGVEAYAAYALAVALGAATSASGRARRFARWSATGSLVLGIGGQAAYHLMTALGITAAPWPVVVVVSALPVVVLGMAAALTHMLRAETDTGTDMSIDDTNTRTAVATTGPVTTRAGQTADTAADTGPDTDADTTPAAVTAEQGADTDTDPDTDADTAADTTRPVPRRRRRLTTGERVARMRARDPQITVAEMARRIGCSDRTVRRYLPPPEGTAGTPAAGPDEPDDDSGPAELELAAAAA